MAGRQMSASGDLAIYSTIHMFPWGGADSMWTAVAREAIASGRRITLLLAPMAAKSPEIRALVEAGAELVECGERATTFSFRAARKLGLPDFGNQAIRYVRARRPERIIVSQGGSFDCANDPFILWLGSNHKNFDLICNQQDECPAVSEEFRSAILKAYSAAGRVVFVSNRNLEVTRRILADSIPNAIQLDYPVRFDPAAQFRWPAGQTWRIAVVGRYSYFDKGLDILFEALESALGGVAGWTVDLFGQGPDERFLHRLLGRYPALNGRVEFAGFRDIEDIWREHHILFLPSRREGCSLAMTEALLRGRPVLATDVGGAAEWIKHGKNGFVCAAPTIPLLREAVTEAWNLRERWKEMGHAAFERARKRYRPSDYRALLAGFDR